MFLTRDAVVCTTVDDFHHICHKLSVAQVSRHSLSCFLSLCITCRISSVFDINKQRTQGVLSLEYIRRVASEVRWAAAQYLVHIMTYPFFKQNSVVNN